VADSAWSRVERDRSSCWTWDRCRMPTRGML
jgi:hypothetical protein